MRSGETIHGSEARPLNEYKEAWSRIGEYIAFVRTRPKSERTELEEDILRAYEEVLINWARQKSRPVYAFVVICYRIVRVLLFFGVF